MKKTRAISGIMDRMRLDATEENIAIAVDSNNKPTVLFDGTFKGKTKPTHRTEQEAADHRGEILNLLNEIEKAEHGSKAQLKKKAKLMSMLLKDFPASVIHNVVIKDRIIYGVNDGSIVNDTQLDSSLPRPSTFKLVLDAASIITGAALISLEALRLYRNLRAGSVVKTTKLFTTRKQ